MAFYDGQNGGVIMSGFLNTLKKDAKKLKEDVHDVLHEANETFEKDAEEEYETYSDYHDLFAWADGALISLPYTDEQISEKDKQMKTLAVMLVKDQVLCAPVNSTIKSIDPAQNTIVLQVNPEQTLAIKVCLSQVSFDRDATILVQPGQKVHTGDELVRFHHPIEAKSKLLLLEPKTFDHFKAKGYAPKAKPGKILHDEILITKA